MKKVGMLKSFLEEGEIYKGLEAQKECAEFGESG